MENKIQLIDVNKARAVLANMAEHLMEAGNPKMAGAVGYAAEVIGKQKSVDAIVSPVNIGQILWCNIPHSEFPLECRVYCICREERNGLVLDYFRCAVKGWFGKAFSFEDIGKTVFLTEAEALAKIDGGNEDG